MVVVAVVEAAAITVEEGEEGEEEEKGEEAWGR